MALIQDNFWSTFWGDNKGIHPVVLDEEESPVVGRTQSAGLWTASLCVVLQWVVNKGSCTGTCGCTLAAIPSGCDGQRHELYRPPRTQNDV